MADWRKRDVLKWPQRMGITMGIAKGIQYLHTGGVTGNDIKLENVLLDETLTARISCYNISLPSKVILVNLQTTIQKSCSKRVIDHTKYLQVGSESPLVGPDQLTRYAFTSVFSFFSLFSCCHFQFTY